MEPSPNSTATNGRTVRIAGESQGCAYVVVIAAADVSIVDALQKLVAALSSDEPVILPNDFSKSSTEPVDSWLEHRAAAEYLGIACSTLYRYSEHHEIESRKFCGRLQYRLSSLDEFKDRHVRPARHSSHAGRIITSALSSGK
jgi:hypothetical protein